MHPRCCLGQGACVQAASSCPERGMHSPGILESKECSQVRKLDDFEDSLLIEAQRRRPIGISSLSSPSGKGARSGADEGDQNY